ncbi:SapC family protein [Alishewanella sp. HL-SH05]|uniref:SapC family protein n=1 Tax=Alishewanella sp. HL-SH05 TaxID=3461145 RepID=UPI004041CFF7
MSNIIALDPVQHQSVCISEQQAIIFAAKQHLINLRVTEIAQLACDLPIFLSKTPYGQWAISALCSVQVENNLWVEQHHWLATYTPMALQTYPLCLMPGSENGVSQVGIFKNELNLTQGAALFDEAAQPTTELKRKTQLLETDLQQEYLTHQFCKVLESLKLIQPIELILHFSTEEQRIQGLFTINEDRLQQLTADELYSLQQQGMLVPIHVMLTSILQLNKLINKHNKKHPSFMIKNIKLAINK